MFVYIASCQETEATNTYCKVPAARPEFARHLPDIDCDGVSVILIQFVNYITVINIINDKVQYH